MQESYQLIGILFASAPEARAITGPQSHSKTFYIEASAGIYIAYMHVTGHPEAN